MPRDYNNPSHNTYSDVGENDEYEARRAHYQQQAARRRIQADVAQRYTVDLDDDEAEYIRLRNASDQNSQQQQPARRRLEAGVSQRDAQDPPLQPEVNQARDDLSSAFTLLDLSHHNTAERRLEMMPLQANNQGHQIAHTYPPRPTYSEYAPGHVLLLTTPHIFIDHQDVRDGEAYMSHNQGPISGTCFGSRRGTSHDEEQNATQRPPPGGLFGSFRRYDEQQSYTRGLSRGGLFGHSRAMSHNDQQVPTRQPPTAGLFGSWRRHNKEQNPSQRPLIGDIFGLRVARDDEQIPIRHPPTGGLFGSWRS